MTSESFSQRLIASLIDSVTQEMIESIEKGQEYRPENSLAVRALALTGAFSGANASEIIEIVTKRGIKNVRLHYAEKTAKQFYNIPMPPFPGAIAFAHVNKFKGLETAFFTRQADSLSIKLAYFDNFSMVENDKDSITQISMLPPRVEQVYSGKWDGNYRTFAERVEPYLDKKTCLLSIVSQGTPEIAQRMALSTCISNLFMEYQMKKKGEKND